MKEPKEDIFTRLNKIIKTQNYFEGGKIVADIRADERSKVLKEAREILDEYCIECPDELFEKKKR